MSGDYQTPERMALKEKLIPLPDLFGKTVLDVGCDHGHWCWLALDRGARSVLGLDRNRDGIDLIGRNLATGRGDFKQVNIGKQWHDFGKFDVVFCFSMYHHIYENCQDHLPIWFWLWRHTRTELLWENPTGTDDPVVRLNVTGCYQRDDILRAAHTYFDIEEIGPGHVKTREVWRCRPRKLPSIHRSGDVTSGGGGASKAFAYANSRRIKEITEILGDQPFPGTLNAKLDHRFGWERDYYRAQILDVVERPGLDGEWKPRWMRFYPVIVNDTEAHAIRFEGENYAPNYVEFIASDRLRDKITESVNVRSC